MVSGTGGDKGDGDKHWLVDDHHGGGEKHKIPAAYKEEHEQRGYANKAGWQPEKVGHPFWHPSPKDLPEPPIHFNHNPVDLELHLGDPRQRLAGMTDEERAYRKQFVQDQKLAPEEPVYVPEFQGNFNPIRRIYRIPWDTLERRVLIPALGYTHGHYIRVMVPKFFMGAFGFVWIYHYMKYNHPTWFNVRRAEIILTKRPRINEKEIREQHPGLMEKGLRNYQVKQDYYNLDFKNRWSHLQLERPLRP